jgi:hypothetical protein
MHDGTVHSHAWRSAVGRWDAMKKLLRFCAKIGDLGRRMQSLR